MFYKTTPPAGTNKQPAIIVPELQEKPSIVALSYTELDLIPPGQPGQKFPESTLRLARSRDGITWEILPSSVVDQVNKTVAALDKVFGYYAIVATNGTGTFNFTTPVSTGAALGAQDTGDTDGSDTDYMDDVEEVADPESADTTTPAVETETPSFFQRVVSFVRGLFE